MHEKVQKTCDLILENRNALKHSMRWELSSNDYALMAAMLTAANGIRADADRYQECKKILRKNISMFSEIRGIVEAAVVTKMTMVSDPETYIRGVEAVYKKLRSLHKLTASASMVIAAMNIYEHTGVARADQDIEKLETLYKELKKQHPLLITDEDRAYLSMIISAGISGTQTSEKIEAAYDSCKKLSVSKDAVQSLAQILALSSGTPDAQCRFVKHVIEVMKQNGKHISKGWTLPAIGALALLDVPEDQLISDIIEADDYFKGKKGFRWFEESGTFRRIYAILAVFLSYSGEAAGIGASIGANITMAIAEEVIMMIIIASTAASSSASSSSSSS